MRDTPHRPNRDDGTESRQCSRRAFLGSSLIAATALAGCSGSEGAGTDSTATPTGKEASTPGVVDSSNAPDVPSVDNPPDAVYTPTHRETMKQFPTIDAGEYAVTPMVTYPHRFWLVSGSNVQKVNPKAVGVHLMTTVWDRETRMVLPVDMGLQVRVRQDGEQIDRRAPWPMISQTMGFHFGDNVQLPEPGRYTVEVGLNPITARKTGGFAGRFETEQTATFEFTFDTELKRTISEATYLDKKRWGNRDALDPMQMDGKMSMPFSSLPQSDSYPGTLLGTPTSGDATVLVGYLSESRLSQRGGYLFVSPRTPYNRVPLADMSLSVSGAVEGELVQTLDDKLGHHYGTGADLSSGETVDITVDSPPQVARHRGYETAFLDMDPVSVTVP